MGHVDRNDTTGRRGFYEPRRPASFGGSTRMQVTARVRAYIPADHAAVVSFLGNTFASLGRQLVLGEKDTDVRDLDAVYGPAKRGAFFVLDAAGRIEGSVGVRPLDIETGELKRLYVAQSWRGHGWGLTLCTAAIQAARSLGYQRVRLDTTRQAVAAIKLFNRIGFRQIGRYNDNSFAELFFELTIPNDCG